MFSLAFLEPGHFHAALLLRAPNPRVDPTIHVYAEPGPDRDSFLDLVRGFNHRTDDPTSWVTRLHGAGQPLDHLVADRGSSPDTVVVLAGRTAPKLATMRRLHEAGLPVLADKPWITTKASVPDLEAVTQGPPLVADIMTERHDARARLRHRLVAAEPLFGSLVPGSFDAPAIEFESVHHLMKTVAGRPLRRPEWYYDVRVQGDGLVDIHSHLVDQAQWLVATQGSDPCAAAVERARRWATLVDLGLYRESTGALEFPPTLAPAMANGVLALECNGEIHYRLGGHLVRQRTEWRNRTPPHGGDAHYTTVRGTRAAIVSRHGPETGHRSELHVGCPDPRSVAVTLGSLLEAWQSDWPGLDMVESDVGFELVLPPTLDEGHETHFARVLDGFLDRLEQGEWPAAHAAEIRARYSLLAEARDLAP